MTVLETLCRNGNLHLLQWLHVTFSVNMDFICKSERSLFATACEYGHLPVVRFAERGKQSPEMDVH